MTAVGVIMGSDSDWATMQGAAEVLADFGVAYEVRVISARDMTRREQKEYELVRAQELAADPEV